MKLSDGIEQAIHCVALMAGLDAGGVLSAAALAEFHGVSPSYLLKHLQALSRAGLVDTLPGPKGGYRLARAPDAISLLDIVLAVEGAEPAFRCAEIRQRGPNPVASRHFKMPCGIKVAMLKAEQAYRAELSQTSVADVLGDLARVDDGSIAARGCAFLALNQRSSRA
jgi:Rrf2 family protein